MDRITKEAYEEAVAKRDAADKIIQAFGKQSIEDFKARWERFDKNKEYFTDADLVYSAGARCDKCGVGLAYPKEADPWHQGTCSNVLKGIGTDTGHGAYPFTFYEIKSENQPSAMGATTRPQEPKAA